MHYVISIRDFFFAVMQTSGRVHVTSLFYTRVSTLTLCSDCYSLIPVYIHHGWSRKFQNTMVIIGEGFPIFLSVDLKNYGAISETRWKSARWSADYTTWKHAGGSHARTQPEVVLSANPQQKAEIIRVRPQRWVVGSYMRYGELQIMTTQMVHNKIFYVHFWMNKLDEILLEL